MTSFDVKLKQLKSTRRSPRRRRLKKVFIVIVLPETYFEREKAGRTGYLGRSNRCRNICIHSFFIYFRRTLKVITLNT